MNLEILKRREPLRIGFLPFSDCAPVVCAHETGLFKKYDLEVDLQRETRWADIRDKVIYGELDAAQAPATLPFLASLGVESDPCACVSGLVLSLQGNAITISRKLWDQGVRDAAALKERIHSRWGKRTYTFGVIFQFSSQEILLRRWLDSAGIAPDAGIRIVSVPPSQMFPTLKLGYLDGYCAGEPWTSLAMHAGVGMCLATSAQLAPLHPEKVLAVRQSFALGRPEQHERLLAALLEACAFCDQPQNWPLISELLSRPEYVNAPADCIEGTPAKWVLGNDHTLNVFSNQNANDPSDAKARWLIGGLYQLLENNPFMPRRPDRSPVLKNIFRRDLYHRASARLLEHFAQTSPEPADSALRTCCA